MSKLAKALEDMQEGSAVVESVSHEVVYTNVAMREELIAVVREFVQLYKDCAMGVFTMRDLVNTLMLNNVELVRMDGDTVYARHIEEQVETVDVGLITEIKL